MRLSFDPAENARNIAERSLSFERVFDLDWDTALSIEDMRKDYGERRLQVFAPMDGRLHAAVITMRGDAIHVISFRRANVKEVERYEETRRRFRVGRG